MSMNCDSLIKFNKKKEKLTELGIKKPTILQYHVDRLKTSSY
jgi:hypothetical protein